MTENKRIKIFDIKNGFSINGGDRLNFKTGIEAVLIKHCDNKSEDQNAFLCTACRSEGVFKGQTFTNNIFSRDGHSAKGAQIHTWKGTGCLRSGNSLHHPWRKKNSERLHYSLNTDGKITGKVYTPVVNALTVPFQDVLKILQSNPSSQNTQFYMKVEFQLNQNEYSILCPCKYLNFTSMSNSFCNTNFLQPISGDVLVELNDRFYVGYLAVRIVEGVVELAEFALMDSINIFETKRKILGKELYKLLKILWVRPLRDLFLTDEYHRIIRLDHQETKCTFLVYE